MATSLRIERQQRWRQLLRPHRRRAAARMGAGDRREQTSDIAPAGSGGSLVRRLSLVAAVWVGVLGLIVASLAVWQYWRASLRGIDTALDAEARALAERITVSEGLLEIDFESPLQVPETATAARRYYGVYDATGRLVDRTSPLLPDELAAGPTPRTRNAQREVVARGPHGSTVIVGESMATVYEDVRRLAASVTIAAIVGAALALPVAVWLRRALARSILQIDRTARTLEPGQPTRIDTRQVDEEFAGVASTLNGAFDRLGQAIVRERQLTSDASHELRTPVTTLVAETQWALGRPRTIEDYRRSLEVCARQAVRMKALVESLLTLARLESGTLPPIRESVALGPLTEETIAELEPLAADRGVSVALEGTATAWADAMQIRILLSNVLSNALRYNRPAGAVRVTMSESRGRARICVADTGIGLEPGLAVHAFERFWRADPARSARDGGSGLGLAISKAIVDAHGGTIRFESASDQGTTVVVELPSAAADPSGTVSTPP